MKFKLLSGLVCLLPVFFFCKKSDKEGSPFNDKPEAIELKTQSVTEASGIVDSYNHSGNCWIHEDSGNPPELIFLGHDGTVRKKVFIAGAVNRDWEDISIAPFSGTSHLYVGDFGDNLQLFNNYTIYRFPEPALQADTVREVQKIRFKYPDRAHDTEAMIVDPNTGDIYIITKRDIKSRVYIIPFPQNTDTLIGATYITELPYNQVVSASISPDGKEILIKTYSSLYYYKRNGSASMESVITGRFQKLPYTMEPQGEAVGFARDGGGFYTISEKSGTEPVKLYYYKRK